MKKLYIIDGYGFVFRAYHSMPPLTNSAGTPVGAVYGFTNMLSKLLNEHKPDYICVAFDSGKETFRTAMYPAYKANRPPAPEDLKPQFPLVRDAVEAFGLQSFELVGFEADDIIATFTKRALEQGIEVVIVSSDKDLMQLVADGKVRMYDPVRQKYITEKEVHEKFGVTPANVLDACALIGDSSDNVPGAAGIGPKTAAELINQFNSLDELLTRTAEIKQPKRREVLENSKEQILLSRELIRLHYDVPLEVDFASLHENIDKERFVTFCQKHGFKSLVGKVAANTPHAALVAASSKTPQQVRGVRNDEVIKSAEQLKSWLVGKDEIAIYELENAVALASATSCSYIKYASGGADLFAAPEGVTKDEVFNLLQNLQVITFSQKSEIKNQKSDNLQLMEYVAATGLDAPEFNEAAPSKKATDDEIKAFALSRAGQVFDRHKQAKQALFDARQLTIYHKIEKPLSAVLARMEAKGAKIDAAFLNAMSAEFASKLAVLEKDIHAMAGVEFNIGSPQQLGEILFDKLAIAGGKKSKKTGAYSTGADVLEEVDHPIAAKVLEWRQLAKLKNTYTDALPQAINPRTGRIHTTYVMTAANTGRLSSQNPNLQNIPIRTEEGRKIRAAFIAEKGNKLISADYSQIELRLLAHVANIQPLIEAFKNGEDVHKATARQVFGVQEVDSDHRRMAKTINFGIIYGQSAFGLAKQLGIGRDEAARFIDAYFKQYPGIKEYMERTKEFCRSHGYVETIIGRKLHIKGINDKNGAIRQFSERAAINAPLQGSAADIIKKAMLQMADLPMTLQVHDELLFEVPEAAAEEMRVKIIQIMQNAVQLSVPLLVDAKIGDNWGQVH